MASCISEIWKLKDTLKTSKYDEIAPELLINSVELNFTPIEINEGSRELVPWGGHVLKQIKHVNCQFLK